jgi:hypothetical protein
MSVKSVFPAAASWTEQAVVNRFGHRAYFDRFGFTVIPGLLSPAQLARAAQEIERINAARHLIPKVRIIGRRNPLLPSCDLEDAAPQSGAAGVARKITGIRALSPMLAQLLVEPPALLAVLHRLLGTRIELYRDALMLKAARVGQEKAWHQDAVYWPFRPMRLISAMIALDRADPGNGCLQVVPGSHHGVLPHLKVAGELQVSAGAWLQRALYVPLQAGDCLIFHSLLLHASEHNHSERHRRASICSYSPGHLNSLDAGMVPPVLISEKVLSA